MAKNHVAQWMHTPAERSSRGRPTAPAVVLAVVVVLAAASAHAQGSIVGSKHDLSTSITDEVCVFCHTPHFANPDAQGPLWNRAQDASKPYTLYTSATMDSTPPAAPSGESLNCLGCHDGSLADVVVNGNPVSDKHELVNAPGSGGIPDTTSYPNCAGCHFALFGNPNSLMQIGTDLTDDHPISISYPPVGDPGFNSPPDPDSGWDATGGLKLFSGNMECSTCHKVHDPTLEPFLRVSVDGSEMCLTCHIK